MVYCPNPVFAYREVSVLLLVEIFCGSLLRHKPVQEKHNHWVSGRYTFTSWCQLCYAYSPVTHLGQSEWSFKLETWNLFAHANHL
ncbi:hypothetical protein LSH36_70g02038 [Paralvinella palmiformis]|uniref:Uncharacterized protein n=1 Tax=Paralvinella palmiformis TaxID=53620 RepID=A0AAD9K442_9ANNE|nr:hypothetical protein LSH36_70g02038 [Paralvinella palmiformis]